MADTFIVGRTIGVDALAAVGCTGSITFLIIGFAQGFTSGLSIRVAQRYGAGDEEGVRRGIACGALLSLAAAVILTVVSCAFTRTILVAMNTPAEILEQAYDYLIVIFAGTGHHHAFQLCIQYLPCPGGQPYSAGLSGGGLHHQYLPGLLPDPQCGHECGRQLPMPSPPPASLGCGLPGVYAPAVPADAPGMARTGNSPGIRSPMLWHCPCPWAQMSVIALGQIADSLPSTAWARSM